MMKKTLLVLVLCVFCSDFLCSQNLIADGTLFLNLDKHSYYNTTTKVTSSIGLEIELSRQLILNNLYFGIGGGYSRGSDNGEWIATGDPFSVTITKTELFGTVKYVFRPEKLIRPFCGLRIKYRSTVHERSGTLSYQGPGYYYGYEPKSKNTETTPGLAFGVLISVFKIQIEKATYHAGISYNF